MDDRNITRNHNIEIIKNLLGYSQISNSTIFRKGNKFILSPAVSKGKNGLYWIDIREINLEKIDTSNTIVIIRIVPDLFVIEKLSAFDIVLEKTCMDNRPNSGNVWGIHLVFKPNNKVVIKSNMNDKKQFLSSIISKNDILEIFQNLNN